MDGDASADAVALTDAFAVGEFYVRSARIEPGEIPLVVGAGAIGLSAVVALAARGVESGMLELWPGETWSATFEIRISAP